jgi:hypothetical protein
VKLYRSRDIPDHWVGEDKHGALMLWPVVPGGWAKRTAYTGGKRPLEEVEPALARGTGWPGGGRARKPRSASGVASTSFGIRVTPEERESWKQAARERKMALSDWVREALNNTARWRARKP